MPVTKNTFGKTRHRKPRGYLPVDGWHTQFARACADMLLEYCHPDIQIAAMAHWTIYVTQTSSSRCQYRTKTITIASWHFDPDELASTYPNDTPTTDQAILYVLAHELAHAILGNVGGNYHGPRFMKIFRQVCPDHIQYLELDYKPRNAAAAGISKPSTD